MGKKTFVISKNSFIQSKQISAYILPVHITKGTIGSVGCEGNYEVFRVQSQRITNLPHNMMPTKRVFRNLAIMIMALVSCMQCKMGNVKDKVNDYAIN